MPKIFKPRPYQEYAVNKILEKPAIALMLDMGLGKTVVTLTAIQELQFWNEVEKVLIIAPLRVADVTWTDERDNWEHLSGMSISKVLGSTTKRVEALKQKSDVYVVNRENVPWLVNYYRHQWPFDMVVIDESSSFKNPQSKRFKSLRQVRPYINRIVELTGTPTPNGMMDLWSQIYLLDMGERLGKTLGAYRRRYFIPCGGMGYVVYNWKLIQEAEKEITEKISDICISMKSEDYLSLPPVVYNTVKVKMPDKVRDIYKSFERDLVLQLDGDEIAATSAGVLSNKLLQLASGMMYNEDGNAVEIHSEKIEALRELVGFNEHMHDLVFYWFKYDLERLKKAFPKAVELKTSEDIKNWNDGKISMLLVHPASAGHGLNLQYGGNVIIWYGLTWSLELYQQANKRLHRSGQTKSVIIHHLIAEGTIEEDVMKALENKNAGQSKMLEAIKARIEKYK